MTRPFAFGHAFAKSPLAAVPSQSEYADLVERIFRDASVLAVIAAGFGNSATGVCEGIASELSHRGRRVVLVSVQALLHASPIALADEAAPLQDVGRSVWFWPSPAGHDASPLKSRTPAGAKDWLASLRHDFDCVLLDCPPLETSPGGAAIAAMAQTAVLAVDSARTPKHQILLDQRLLQLSGVKLSGCVLVQSK